ncbi:hypothetical protein J4573_09245 [Actinomadura barringtoniae]|uniref:SseB family protein n=1 Tax=Actinomadura barringtoniae TaxID=1427535 RepID=A0A939P7W2_9ACTN|nr:hypothetical protein [Actinomadura barringtoniae]MBO2447268.1 hypothetical protein [Actinomadura barringtoniae]
MQDRSENSLNSIVNQSTPHAPADADETAQRLATLKLDQHRPVDPRDETSPSQTGHAQEQQAVYAPVSPEKSSNGNYQFELRRQSNGSAVLPIFTDEQLLVRTLGQYQPKIHLPLLELLIQVAGRSPIIVNPMLAPGAEVWTRSDLDESKKEQS